MIRATRSATHRLLFLLALGACTSESPKTSVRVTVSAYELTVPVDVDTVRVTVINETAGKTAYESPNQPVCAGGDRDCLQFPITLLLVPGPNAPDDEVVVRADAYKNGVKVISTAAAFHFVPNQRATLDLLLFGRCLGSTTCPDNEGALACGPDGECVTVEPPAPIPEDGGTEAADLAECAACDAGQPTDGGVLAGWTVTTLSPTDAGIQPVLRAVWGTTATNVYVAGGPGTLLRFDGTTWADDGAPGRNYYGLAGRSASDVFAVGSGNTVVHKDDVGWAVLRPASPEMGIEMRDISVLPNGDAYYVNSLGKLYFRSAAGLESELPAPVSTSLNFVLPLAAALYVGDNTSVYRQVAGEGWMPLGISGLGDQKYRMAVAPSGRLWLATNDGVGYSDDGVQFATANPQYPRNAIWVFADDDVYVGGSYSSMSVSTVLWHLSGTTWSLEELSPDGGAIKALWGGPTGELFAVTARGQIWHRP